MVNDLGIIIALLLFAGSMKGLMDSIAFPGGMKSWRNKYKTTKNGSMITESKKSPWYLGFRPIGWKERFPYSTTVLVCFTDVWHACQFLMLRSAYTACMWMVPMSILFKIFMVMAILPIVFGIGFKATYR